MAEFLDGIVISGSVESTANGINFLLPPDYARGNSVPDWTGFQTYSSQPGGKFAYQAMERITSTFVNAKVATIGSITLSGTQSIDGVSLVVGDRVLVKNQLDRKTNGLYVVASGTWTRASETLIVGLDIWVSDGTTNGKKAWTLISQFTSIVIGTTEIIFESAGIELGFIESGGTNLSYLGRVLASGIHQNRLNLGWETIRFKSPVVVSQTMLNDRFNLKFSDVVGESAFAWPSPLRYRILSAVADSGQDAFGNTVRGYVNRKNPENLSVNNSFWMSKPNPSKFAVESLYFDHLTEITIDHIEVDPVTPGLIMSVYYSNDGEPGVSPDDWDNGRLWKRVPRTFRLTRKNKFALPQPISARYVKLEFSSLQARPYNPGNFNTETEYSKHPKWVLDYFLIDMELKRLDDLTPTVVDVIHSAYSLAFSYYMDEQRPLNPNELGKIEDFTQFLNKSDVTNLVDIETSARIDYNFSPYMISGASPRNSILGSAISGLYRSKMDMSIVPGSSLSETMDSASMAIMTEVSTLNRETLMSELNYPEMFFFVTCRHKYRVVKSIFKDKRAYFAGINTVRFIRDTYTSNSSPAIYNETFSDTVNIEINDFA